MTTGTLPPPTDVEDPVQETLDVDAVCERVERRFDHVDGNEFMSLLKSWILEILRERGV